MPSFYLLFLDSVAMRSALAQDLWISKFGTLSRMVHFLLAFYYETIDFQLWLRISGFLDFGRCPDGAFLINSLL